MSIPLVQEATKDAINTSIIAIKRNIERINMLLGLSNSEEIDTSKFATKEELQQAVTDLQPVDEVAVDNMHSVTSNAVADALGYKANTLPYFDNADTDRTILQNRINAIQTYIPRNKAGIYTIRYEGGFYFAYITNGLGGESSVIEIDLYSNRINLFYRENATNTVTFRREI